MDMWSNSIPYPIVFNMKDPQEFYFPWYSTEILFLMTKDCNFPK